MKKLFFSVRFLVLGLALGLLHFSAFSATQANQAIYLYHSPLMAQFEKEGDRSYEHSIGIWRKHLGKYRQNFKVINRSELLGKLQSGVLVLASTHLLDNDERRAIKDFARSGGSLIATGATGSRDASGQFIGHEFLDSLFQVRVRGEYNAGSQLFLIPFGDGPLTWPLPAGRRIHLGNNTKGILRIESDNLAAVLTNWERAKDDVGPNGAIAFHESDTHRGVFFAFPESTWGSRSPRDMTLMLDSVMAWLRREPKLFKAAWPAGYSAAHLIEMDTEDQFFSAPNFADHLEKIGVKGTFYCLTSEAIQYPAIVKNLLARGHEIAYHADIHIGFKGQDLETQERRILNMKSQMQTILGASTNLVTGFRAPTEGYDKNTERLLRKHGIMHHAANPGSTQDRLPFFSASEPGLGSETALVILPRTQVDDIDFKKLLYGVARVQETLAYDLDLVVKGGAFGLLSVHSQNYVDGGLMLEAMGKYMDKVATYKDRLWIARGDQIASWWRKRDLVRVSQSAKGDEISLHVSVKSPGSVEDLTVFITNPARNRRPTVQAVGTEIVKVKIKPLDEFRTALVFEKLGAGDFEYLVRFP